MLFTPRSRPSSSFRWLVVVVYVDVMEFTCGAFPHAETTSKKSTAHNLALLFTYLYTSFAYLTSKFALCRLKKPHHTQNLLSYCIALHWRKRSTTTLSMSQYGCSVKGKYDALWVATWGLDQRQWKRRGCHSIVLSMDYNCSNVAKIVEALSSQFIQHAKYIIIRLGSYILWKSDHQQFNLYSTLEVHLLSAKARIQGWCVAHDMPCFHLWHVG